MIEVQIANTNDPSDGDSQDMSLQQDLGKFTDIKYRSGTGKSREEDKIETEAFFEDTSEVEESILNTFGDSRRYQFACEFCNKTLHSKYVLLKHQKKVHTDLDGVKCRTCFIRFLNEESLKVHVRFTHERNLPYKCKNCDLSYGSISGLCAHNSRTHKEKNMKCEWCGKLFSARNQFNVHVKNHVKKSHKKNKFQQNRLNDSKAKDQDKPIQKEIKNMTDCVPTELPALQNNACTICGKTYASSAVLRKHQNTLHKDDNLIRCRTCFVKFADEEKLRAHVELLHKRNLPYQCDQCDLSYSTKDLLYIHFCKKHREKHLKCNQCDKTFSMNYLYKIHRKTHEKHNGKILERKRKPKKRKLDDSAAMTSFEGSIFECSHCEQTFPTQTKLQHHRADEHNLKLTCLKCGVEFDNSSALHAHRKSEHWSNTRHVCEICARTFARKEGLIFHMKNFHFEGTTNCDVCQKEFCRPSLVIKHKKLHAGPNHEIVCKDCPQLFLSYKELLQHRKRDHAELFHNCPICTAQWTTAAKLEEHMKDHEISTLIECGRCDKSFDNNYEYNLHAQKHKKSERKKTHVARIKNGEVPTLSCQICGKIYMLQRYLDKHYQDHEVVAEDKRYKCDECDKTFKTLSTLRRHRLIHTGERCHLCDICGKDFKRRDHMTKHRKICALKSVVESQVSIIEESIMYEDDNFVMN